MKFTGNAKSIKGSQTSCAPDGNENVGGGGGRLVVVGVKLDQQSRELLTWALVKVAQPGDRVVALHILHASTEEQSTLLALVKTFDAVLAVYEGFCHLKQVDLKLKVCRGSSVRRSLVREAKEYDGATIIVGISQTHHTIRSPVSVAKYCARKLPRSFSIFAVDNGKILFQREATRPTSGNCNQCHDSICRSASENLEVLSEANDAITEIESDQESHYSPKPCLGARRSTLIERYLGCAPVSTWADYCSRDMVEESSDDRREDSSLALVPYEPLQASPKPNLAVSRELRDIKVKHGWQFIRRVLLPRHKRIPHKVSMKNTSADPGALKLSVECSPTAVHPVEKHCDLAAENDNLISHLDAQSGAIMPVGTNAVFSRPSFHGSKYFPKELEDFHEKYSATCRLFSYQELLSATFNFSPDRMVGKGGSSRVFRGSLPDGKELAVKILKPTEDVLKEFIAEVAIITTINHKNIISLLGYCFEDENLILVYDLLSRGSLEENLHGNRKDVAAFGWEERYMVAMGVAEALDHLHTKNSQPVIHRDVKSSNILLSDDFEPQLADFGLATWASGAVSYMICSDVAGTFGYLAPEYFLHGRVTEKIDVYAFGIVLLELLSGRKPIDNRNPKGQESLVMWATPIIKDGKLSHLLDPSLGRGHDQDQIERMVLAAILCIRREPRLRPRIGVVLKLLQGDAEATKWVKQQIDGDFEDSDIMDGEASPTDIQTHLNVAFLDIEDDVLSVGSTEPNVSIEDYLKGRWSRVPSFD